MPSRNGGAVALAQGTAEKIQTLPPALCGRTFYYWVNEDKFSGDWINKASTSFRTHGTSRSTARSTS